MEEDDWTYFLAALDAPVFDAFMGLVELLEVSRDFADSFCAVIVGHPCQLAEPADHNPLVSGRQWLNESRKPVQRLMNRAA